MLNINVGVLGHVDCGKTSLSKALSVQASTACFDKNPQSRQRGITLDLGFSTFSIHFNDDCDQSVFHVPLESLGARWLPHRHIQITLVDCPGHASLIRTIIGGAQIIDVILLVIDVTKGVQTQTAECLMIGQIVCKQMILVLNKIDLIPEQQRDKTIQKLTSRLHKTLENTSFADCPVVKVAAHPGGGLLDSGDKSVIKEPIGLRELVSALATYSPVPVRSSDGDFLFAVDHCFGIKGQGTVMTGTVLSGSVKIGQNVELPHLKLTRKVKSMQIFRQPVEQAIQGDRVGICLTQVEPSQIERSLLCSPPGSVPVLYAAIVQATKIPHFKLPIKSKCKFHISIGHETVMATMLLFRYSSDSTNMSMDLDQTYEYVDELPGNTNQFLTLLTFERPVIVPSKSILIGSKLDADINLNMCRIAFHGAVELSYTGVDYLKTELLKLNIFKRKSREGRLERVQDQGNTIIVADLFRKETSMDAFVGLKVDLSSGQRGQIEGSFGQSGKCKIRMLDELPAELVELYSGGKKKSNAASATRHITVTLHFVRLIFDPAKKMIQYNS